MKYSTYSLAIILIISSACATTTQESALETTSSDVTTEQKSETKEVDAEHSPVTSDSKTEEVMLHGEEIFYEANGIKLKGYLAFDPSISGPRPGVIVVHEWWGHNEYVRRRARMLAKLGYVALAVDMYGDGKLANHPAEAKAFMQEVIGNKEIAKARYMAGMDVLKQHELTKSGNIAAIGYCFGGAVALHMARAGEELKGVASIHGSLGTDTPAQPGVVQAKILVLTGGDDPFVPSEQVEAFRNEMASANISPEIVIYPDARHAFTVPEATKKGTDMNLPLKYDEAADKDSWSRLEKFLAEIFAE